MIADAAMPDAGPRAPRACEVGAIEVGLHDATNVYPHAVLGRGDHWVVLYDTTDDRFLVRLDLEGREIARDRIGEAQPSYSAQLYPFGDAILIVGSFDVERIDVPRTGPIRRFAPLERRYDLTVAAPSSVLGVQLSNPASRFVRITPDASTATGLVEASLEFVPPTDAHATRLLGPLGVVGDARMILVEPVPDPTGWPTSRRVVEFDVLASGSQIRHDFVWEGASSIAALGWDGIVVSSEPSDDPASARTRLALHTIVDGSASTVASIPGERFFRALSTDRAARVAIASDTGDAPWAASFTVVDVESGVIIEELVDGSARGRLALGALGTPGGGFGALYGSNAADGEWETQLGFRCFGAE